jgi:uncharacterized protein involved in outer membrane biogenesis
MRRALIIGGGFIGLIILILAGLLGYAVLNLNSLIQQRRDYLLSRVSDAIGRTVTVDAIKASLGWGVLIDLSGVQVAGDPAFSRLPLVQAQDLYLKVEFLPLLFHEIRITELRLTRPIVHVIRNQAGELNLAALARQRAARFPLPPNPHAATPPGGPSAQPNVNPLSLAQPAANRPFAAVSIHRFALTDGIVDYLDQSAPNRAPVELQDVQISVDDFSLHSRFDVDLSFAALGTGKNFDLSGTIGPLITDGALDLNAIPLSLKAELGPVTFSQLQAFPKLAPPPLTIIGPLNVAATAEGTVDAINFTVNSDLAANQITWQPSFSKPSGTTMTVVANGTRTADRMTLSSIDLVLASLKAHLTQVHLAPGHLAAHIATNEFAIAPVAAMIPAAATYHPSGTAKLDTAVKLGADQPPILDGSAALSAVALVIPEVRGGAASITRLSGPIRFGGNAADIGPLTFNLGSAHARLDAEAQSLQPPRLSYRFKADQLVLVDMIPSRQQFAPEYLSSLTATGTASVSGTPGGTLNVTAATGLIQNVPFTNLAIAAAYASDQVTLNSFAFNSCDGRISGNGVATLGMVPGFDVSLATQGLDLQKALTAVKAKAANTVRGQLTGNLSLSGHGQDFARIRPTLRGNGNAQVVNAKLVGVNVAAQALRKINHLPAIGSLVPQSVVNNHPELFASPDTDIQSASLTFVIFGQRLTTHDFAAQAIDYNAAADGWFDLDKDLNMNAQIILSQPFSGELIAARKNVAFLADRDGQIIIPLRITGRLPHPQVMPNIDILAQRAASNAMQNKLGGLLDKGGKDLGGIFKHGNPLQGLFH